MRGKTHCTIGILSTIQACILFKIPISIFNLVLAAIFSILPDLDESNSTISNVFLKQDASKLILKIVIYIINQKQMKLSASTMRIAIIQLMYYISSLTLFCQKRSRDYTITPQGNFTIFYSQSILSCYQPPYYPMRSKELG